MHPRTLAVGAVLILASASLAAQEAKSFADLVEIFRSKNLKYESWTNDYEMDMAMQGMTLSGRGTQTAKGDRMVQNMTMDVMGQTMSVKSVVDENGIMWSETNAMGQHMVMKMDMSVMMKLSEEMAGLDFPGMGDGFNNLNQDPLEVLESFSAMYQAESIAEETKDGVPVYTIKARLQDGASEGYDPTGMMAAMGMSMDKMDLSIGREDGFMRHMAILGADGAPIMTMAMKNLKFNVDIPDATFEYTPPAGVQIMDMTEQMQEMLDQMESGEFDPSTVDEEP
jgi:hypothetical protein